MVSVILPVLNGVATIENSIKSVLAQTYTDLELVIVDNGSTDGTIELCQSYEAKEKRIRLLHSKVTGVVAGRKLGIDNSKGQQISFIDADDTYEPIMLEKMVEALSRYDADIVSCGYNCIEPYGKKSICISKMTGEMNQDVFFSCLFEEGTLGFLWNKLYTRETVTEMIYPEGMTVCEDLYMNCSLMLHPHKIVVLNESLYNYFLNPMSVTHDIQKKVDDKGHWKYMTAYQKIADLCAEDSDKYSQINKSLEFIVKLGVEEMMSVKGYTGTKRELLNSLRKYLFSFRNGNNSFRHKVSTLKTYILGELNYYHYYMEVRRE